MIKQIITFRDLIFYWDLRDCVVENENYYVYANDRYVLTTGKTHFTLRNMEKPTGSVEIYTDSEKQNLFYSTAYTLPDPPKMIDISKAPYNAVGDGKVMNTKAIQKAIEDCKDGECVYIPKGTFLTGALDLHSDMSLYIEEGGTLLGSEKTEDYLPKIWTRFEGIEMECYRSLLNLGNIQNRDQIACSNVMIFGGGTICGGGRPLAENVLLVERENLKDYMKSLGDAILTYENFDTIPGRLRPKLVNISCSQNVVLDNIDFKNGSCWNLHMIYSNNIITCNSSIYSRNVWNGDGWDPDSSTNCTIFNCVFNTEDDCIAIKSGRNPEGNIISKPSRDIRIFDCRSENGRGIAVGSEMSGGVSDVYIWDCDISKSNLGLELKGAPKRGGYVKNIHVSRCILSRVMLCTVGYNNDGEAAPTEAIFADCLFENLILRGECMCYEKVALKPCYAIELLGMGEHNKAKNFVFKNIVIENATTSEPFPCLFHHMEGLCISNLTVK